MIEIKITPEMISRATDRFNKLDLISVNKSAEKFGHEFKRIKYGLLGEEMVFNHLGVVGDDNYDYDLLYKGSKIDIKTISCKFQPRLDYLCTVNSSELERFRKQNTDYYFFTRIKYDGSVGWLLGYKKSEDFFKEADYVGKGDIVADVKFEKANAYVLEISRLKKFSVS